MNTVVYFSFYDSVLLYNLPYSCRKLSTVLGKVICLYYYSCYITTASIELPQQINKKTLL